MSSATVFKNSLSVAVFLILVTIKSILQQHLDGHVKMSLILLLPSDGLNPLLFLQPLAYSFWYVLLSHWAKDLCLSALLDVHQHVGVCAVPRGHHLLPLPTEVVIYRLLLSAPRYNIIVKLAPLAITSGVNE